MTKKSSVIPVFIIGAARNGTTQLGNLIGEMDEVASVDDELHYGACENALYYLERFWGKLDNPDSYLDFLYNFSSSDFFHLADGDMPYHLANRRDNCVDFFLDLMDRHAENQRKKFWVTKLDPAYFADKKRRMNLLSKLGSRYPEVKFISIKRELESSLASYLYMEGASFKQRQNKINMLPALFLQISRYNNVYRLSENELGENHLRLKFESFIKEKEKMLPVCGFLNVSPVRNSDTRTKYAVNTSFVKQEKISFRKPVIFYIKIVDKIMKNNPRFSQWVHKMYINNRPNENPIYRRILKKSYFKDDLRKELQEKSAHGILENL